MNQSPIEQLRPLVEAETGMDFSGGRFVRLRDAFDKVVTRHVDANRLANILANPRQRAVVLDQLTAELTIGESFFFRNEHHFRALREDVVPAILRANAERQEIRIWSAGCAGGEEPYSVAILLDQLLGTHQAEWSVSILATDLNTEFLERARKAEYRIWSFRRTTIHHDPNYFTTHGELSRLVPHVRERARFLYLNLVKDVYPSPLTGTVGLDLILFRNVAIYLQPEVIRAIVARFHRCLRPGGWLLLGEAEVSQIRPDGFGVRRFGQATFFQKADLAEDQGHFNRPPTPLLPIAHAPETKGETRLAFPPPPTPAPPNALVDDNKVTTITSRPMSVPPPQAPRDQGQAEFDWERIETCLTRKDFHAAESEFSAIRNPQQRAEQKLIYVRRLLELSHVARADEVLNACLREHPLLIDGYLLKASLAEERGKFNDAEFACRRALYLDRNSAMAHFQMAIIQQQVGNDTGARKSLRLVKKLAGSQDANALVVHGDGVCYGRLWEMAQTMLGP